MTKLTCATRSSTEPGRRPVTRGGTLPKAVLDGAAELRKKLLRLDALDLTALLRADNPHLSVAPPGIPGATRMHALDDAELLSWTLMDLHLLVRGRTFSQGGVSGDGKADETVVALRPIVDVHHAVDAMGPKVATICEQAGLETPEAVLASHRWVRRVALYMSGFAGHVFGKARQRHLKAIVHDAQHLLAALPRLGKWAQADALARRNKGVLPRAQLIAIALEMLLPRLLSNATYLLTEMELGLPGGAEVPDPVRFAAEGALAIWLQHHPKIPNLSRNRGSFLVFGETLLALSVEALDKCPPKWIRKTTLSTALRDEVENNRTTIIH